MKKNKKKRKYHHRILLGIEQSLLTCTRLEWLKKSETSSQDDRGLLRGCFNLTEADEGCGLIRWTRSLPNVRLNLLENAIFMLFLLGLMIVNNQIYNFWVVIDKFHSSRLLEQKLKSGTSNYSTSKWREIAQYQIVC